MVLDLQPILNTYMYVHKRPRGGKMNSMKIGGNAVRHAFINFLIFYQLYKLLWLPLTMVLKIILTCLVP
jgi:hypothetical protein